MPDDTTDDEYPDSLTDYENMLKIAVESAVEQEMETECSAYSHGPSQEES